MCCQIRIFTLSIVMALFGSLLPNVVSASGCMNVVVSNNGFAYGACDDTIEVVELATLTKSRVNIPADDIAIDTDENLIFVQSGRLLTALSIVDPSLPIVMDSVATNFSFFSGVSAANGVLVVSAGAGSANTQVFTYAKALDGTTSLALATNGIPLIDNAVGNPDVHLSANSDGVIAFYSQDIGSVANFAIQPVLLNAQGLVLSIQNDIVLTRGGFDFGLGLNPANFPVESEFLDNKLYVAHFAAQGIEVIDLNNNSLLTPIALSYEPTNITTDGVSLFVVGSTHDSIDVIDPSSLMVIDNIQTDEALTQAFGIAASKTHIVVADNIGGLVVIERLFEQPEVAPKSCFPLTVLSDNVSVICF